MAYMHNLVKTFLQVPQIMKSEHPALTSYRDKITKPAGMDGPQMQSSMNIVLYNWTILWSMLSLIALT